MYQSYQQKLTQSALPARWKFAGFCGSPWIARSADVRGLIFLRNPNNHDNVLGGVFSSSPQLACVNQAGARWRSGSKIAESSSSRSITSWPTDSRAVILNTQLLSFSASALIYLSCQMLNVAQILQANCMSRADMNAGFKNFFDLSER